MKTGKQLLVTIAAICTVSLANSAEPTRMSDETVPFAYESKAEIPTPKENLAKIISIDYKRAPDEFTAYELFEKIEPVIEKRLTEAKQTEEWFIIIGDNLEKFDFSKKGFPTGIESTTFIPYDNGYALSFTNAEDFSFLPLEIQEAKKLSSSLQRDRRVGIRITGKVASASEAELNYNTRKVIKMEISSLSIELNSGMLVGELTKEE